ncbi:MAG: hypothetical protein LBJ61_00120 [Deltaproteobacteria bacterium]|nr:hypothetical protein [Deltaproteobacteria bacterium]
MIELNLKDNKNVWTQAQILGYMDRLLVNEGWLLIFDSKSDKSWAKKITWITEAIP